MSGGDAELLTDFRVIPAGEQLRMMASLLPDTLQSTSQQFFDGEHAL